MKKRNIIFLIIIILLLVGIIFVFTKNDKQEEINNDNKEETVITKDEAYEHLKEFYLEENDILIYLEEKGNEYAFELKGSCKFEKCIFYVDKETKQVSSFAQQ